MENRDIFFAVNKELKNLGSRSLADSKANSNQLLNYLKNSIKEPNVVIAKNVWNLHPTQKELDIDDPAAQFPAKEFKEYIANQEKEFFILPSLLKMDHCVGFLIKKSESKFIISYFNPTGTSKADSGEDKEALERISKELDYKHQIEIKSDEQQKNGIDCIYIVGQTLKEIACGKPISVKRFNSSNISEYVKPIAKARADFCDPQIMGEDNSNAYLRDQIFYRLGNSMTANVQFANEINDYLKFKGAESNLNKNIFSVVSQLAFRIDGNDFNGVPGFLLTDKVIYILNAAKELKTCEFNELHEFCETLLEPHFPEHGDIIFKLNKNLKHQIDEKVKSNNNETILDESTGIVCEYDEDMIYKTWDVFISKKLNLKFYVKDNSNESLVYLATIFGVSTNSMSTQKDAALLINQENLLHKIKYRNNEYSISICHRVKSSLASSSVNEISSDLEISLSQIKYWNEENENNSENKINSHIILFPYHVGERDNGHWILGLLKLKIEQKKIISVEMETYDPLGQNGKNFYATDDVKINFKEVIKIVFPGNNIELKEVPEKHIQQQSDVISCGVITAENAKDIFEGKYERLKMQYPSNALDLRKEHLKEVEDTNFRNRFYNYNSDIKGDQISTQEKDEILADLKKIAKNDDFKHGLETLLINCLHNKKGKEEIENKDILNILPLFINFLREQKVKLKLPNSNTFFKKIFTEEGKIRPKGINLVLEEYLSMKLKIISNQHQKLPNINNTSKSSYDISNNPIYNLSGEKKEKINMLLKRTGYLKRLKITHSSFYTRNLEEGFIFPTPDDSEIPMFCVITGVNGIGKSTILNLIEQTYRNIENGSQNKEWKFDRNVVVGSDLFLEFDFEEINNENLPQLGKLDINQFTNSANNRNYNNIHQANIREILKDFESYFIAKIMRQEECKPENYPKLQDVYDDAINIFRERLNNKDNDIEYILREAKKYVEDKLNVHINSYNDIQLLVDKNDLNDINFVLQRYRFKYKLIKDKQGKFKLSNSNSNIDFYDLSPGEKVQLTTLLWLVDKNLIYQNRLKKSILLLDEPDAHMHPPLIKKIIDTLVRIVIDWDLQIIMTTHNPTTISFIPKDNIFIMSYSEKTIIEPAKTQRQAMMLLNSDVVFVNKPFKLIFVEADNDKKFYESIYKNLIQMRLLYPSDQIIFKSFGINTKKQSKKTQITHDITNNDGGNSSRDKVEEFVGQCTKLRKDDKDEGYSLENFIYGIVDDDNDDDKEKSKRKNNPNMRYLSRYSIENYIFDPICLFLYFLINNKEPEFLNSLIKNLKIENVYFNNILSELANNANDKEKIQKLLQHIINEFYFIFSKMLQGLIKLYELNPDFKKNDKQSMKYVRRKDDDNPFNTSDILKPYKERVYSLLNPKKNMNTNSIIEKELLGLIAGITSNNRLKFYDFEKDQFINDAAETEGPLTYHLNSVGKIELYLPKLFLKMRGHDLELVYTFIFSSLKHSPMSHKSYIVNCLYGNELNNQNQKLLPRVIIISNDFIKLFSSLVSTNDFEDDITSSLSKSIELNLKDKNFKSKNVPADTNVNIDKDNSRQQGHENTKYNDFNEGIKSLLFSNNNSKTNVNEMLPSNYVNNISFFSIKPKAIDKIEGKLKLPGYYGLNIKFNYKFNGKKLTIFIDDVSGEYVTDYFRYLGKLVFDNLKNTILDDYNVTETKLVFIAYSTQYIKDLIEVLRNIGLELIPSNSDSLSSTENYLNDILRSAKNVKI